MSITQETRLKKAHIALMKHPHTALYSGVVMMGKSSVVDEDITAYTDGVNKRYGRKFISNLTDAELRALVLHENLHVALKHMPRFIKEYKANPTLINASADYVVNDVIVSVNDSTFLKLPSGGLYDEMFHDWSVKQVYDYLKKEQEQQSNGGQGGQGGQGSDGLNNNPRRSDSPNRNLDTLDEHDFDSVGELSQSEVALQATKIDKALREGGILAGRLGGKTPRVIEELLTPKVDWRKELREFVTGVTRGSDEFTWRKFNKRMMANDLYMPSLENESVGELIVAIDTSGSIGGKELTEFATELASICLTCSPSQVRVLWWDTNVHGEQVFDPNNYGQIAGLLKPMGGGGTLVSCVSEYVSEKKLNPEGLLVFTDGYVESDIQWNVSCPTLWLVTENRNFTAPTGVVINKED